MTQHVYEVIKQVFSLEKTWLELSPKWRSQYKDHRLALRKDLKAFVENLLKQGELPPYSSPKQQDKELLTLEDLNQIPYLSVARVSVSHCPLQGGFWLASTSASIGFDIEDASRVDTEIVARMSSKKEQLAAPGPAHLWSAKEAAFKALPQHLQPSVISDIFVSQWVILEPGAWVFRVSSSNVSKNQGRGLIMNTDNVILGFFALCS